MAAAEAEAEALDFEPEDDDLMDEDVGDLSPRTAAAPLPKLESAITSGSVPRQTKGRGFREEADANRDARLSSRDFDSLDADGGPGALRSIEGWIILVTGLHEESQEDDLQNAFGVFGEIKNLHLNLDRRTGFVKGYALIEYENFKEAQDVISQMNGTELLTQIINVDWAFSNGPSIRRRNMKKRRIVNNYGWLRRWEDISCSNIRWLGMPSRCSFLRGSATQGLLFVTAGSISFVAFVYAAVVSKLLPRSDNAFISAVQKDRYYCFLVPFTFPILMVAVYLHWLSMKLFKHA